MIAITTEDANQLVQAILNMPLQYGFFYREIGMFDFGFGNKIGFTQSEIDVKRCVHEYALHVICEYDVVWKNGQRCVKRFNWDTELSAFHAVVSDIVGLVVKRITIDEANKLWIDLGKYWIVLLPLQSKVESWRFFSPYTEKAHLVATDSSLFLQY